MSEDARRLSAALTPSRTQRGRRRRPPLRCPADVGRRIDGAADSLLPTQASAAPAV